jgi:hypothetical protein
MDEESHKMPFDIESPIPIMFWEPLEFCMAITFLGFGVVTSSMVLGMIGCGCVLVGARYLKRGAKRGAMQHFIWSLGLQADSALSKKFKPAWLNDFIE